MMKRQNDCEEGADWNPITIFAEGSTTNGTHIVKFKKGAFKSMRTIKPCIVKTSGRFFNQAWEVLPFGHYLTLSGLYGVSQVLLELPVALGIVP